MPEPKPAPPSKNPVAIEQPVLAAAREPEVETLLCDTCEALRQELASRKEAYTRNMESAARMLDEVNIENATLKKLMAQARNILA